MNVTKKLRLRVALLIICFGSLTAIQNASAQNLKVWDNKPAKDWMTDAYPKAEKKNSVINL